MTTFHGTEAVNVYRLTALGVTLKSYASQVAKHGKVIISMSRMATPAAMMKLAKAEGFKGKAKDYAGASDFIMAKRDAAHAELPEGAITP